jgi:hypothetical protein
VLKRAWPVVALLLGAIALASAFSGLAWSKDYPTTNWSGPFRNAGDVIVIVFLACYIVWMSWLLVVSGRKSFVYMSLGCVTLWVIAPAWSALALWDDDTSARELLRVSWFWLLKPLPIDVGGALGLAEPDHATLGTLDGITFVMLQIATLALIISNIGMLVSHYRDRWLDRLRSEVLGEAGQPPEH